MTHTNKIPEVVLLCVTMQYEKIFLVGPYAARIGVLAVCLMAGTYVHSIGRWKYCAVVLLFHAVILQLVSCRYLP